MERRSPTGIAAREGRETALSPKGGQQTLRVRCHQFPAVLTHRSGADPHQRNARKWSAGLRPASTAERRSKPPRPAGAESAEWSAGLRPASRPERAAKPRYPQKAGSKPSGFAAISFPAVLTHRGGGDPHQRRARKWSAGLRPASTAERRSKPPRPAGAKRGNGAPVSDRHRGPRGPRNRAIPKRRAANPPGSLPSVSPRCYAPQRRGNGATPPAKSADNGAPVSDRHRGPRGPRNRAIPIPLTKRTTTASLARARKDLLSRDCSGCRRPPGSGVFRPG